MNEFVSENGVTLALGAALAIGGWLAWKFLARRKPTAEERIRVNVKCPKCKWQGTVSRYNRVCPKCAGKELEDF